MESKEYKIERKEYLLKHNGRPLII